MHAKMVRCDNLAADCPIVLKFDIQVHDGHYILLLSFLTLDPNLPARGAALSRQ